MLPRYHVDNVSTNRVMLSNIQTHTDVLPVMKELI